MSKSTPSQKGTQSNPKSSKKTTPKPKDDVVPEEAFENLRHGIEAQLHNKDRKKESSHFEKPSSKKDRADQGSHRGKKRARDGKILEQARPHPNPPVDKQETGEDTFESEVRALGGTNEDVELLADAQSDSEVEGVATQDPPTGKSKKSNDLDKGMTNILKEIALAQGQEDASSDTDASSQSENENVQPVMPTQPVKDRPSKKGKSRLKVEPRPDWYTEVDGLDLPASDLGLEASSQVLVQVRTYAESLLKEENEIYREERHSSSGQSFYNTVIASGTLSDKISALTLGAQESPVHNVKALETLIALSKKRSRAQAVDVLRALKDLFAQGSLLPGSRRLYTFTTQPVLLRAFAKKKTWTSGDKLPKAIGEQHLIAWAFEAWLKDQYFEILKTLEVWCNDEIEFAKSRAMSYVYELLKEKPEQESNLLKLLVNKLGDPVKKIASQASYLLRELLQVHPAMKSVVVSAIETDFIFRPGQSLHGKYYATVTLNQTPLSSHQEGLAVKLFEIYFGLFAPLLKAINNIKDEANDEKSFGRGERRRGKKEPVSGQAQSDELREKLTSAILTGVNRAYPYAGSDDKSFAQHLDTLFKIAHSANFNTSIQAMLLIQQLSASHQPSSDRFYRVLYESLLDPRLIAASKQQMYLNLLHRSLKADMNSKRAKAFVKRILQVLSLHEPSFICGAFFLLKDLDISFPGLAALVDQFEEAEDEEEVFRDADGDADLQDSLQHTQPRSAVAYDAHKRAPEHANADNSCAWEVLPFLAHFHPSVVASAEHYMKHKKLPGKPDLALHTLIHFLDRFVYKNAKLSDAKMHGSSIMQPMASENTRAVLLNATAGGKQRLPVNTEEFRAQNLDNVAVEDVFFHQYFQTLGKDVKKTKKQEKGEMEEIESEDEDAVWDAMMKSAPELDMDEDDEDLGMSDLDSDDEDDDEDDEGDEAADDQSDSSGVDVESGIFDDDDEEMQDIDGDDAAGVPTFADLESEDDMVDEAEIKAVQEPEVDSARKSHTDKKTRKKLKSLPIFASADDYAEMIDDDEGEDIV